MSEDPVAAAPVQFKSPELGMTDTSAGVLEEGAVMIVKKYLREAGMT